ncbi:MAG: cysteine--tRNA ligase [Candidatus Paceibacterota bacterium]|jgi:cysteinyl-tRNA synthetase
MILDFFRKKEEKPIYLFNTLSKQKELFKSIKKCHVSFYQCGPTVYWTQHLGNLRAATLSDFIRKTFVYLGYKVKFVRNYTDVGHLVSDGDSGEDKMEKGVKREGLSPRQIADKYIEIFENDIKDLNIPLPDFTPRATDYIKEIIQMIETLLKKGFAYSTDLAIYFDVTKAKDYTRLSRQNLEENRAGSGHADVEDKQKRNHVDFALWFFRAGTHKNAIQYWPSPFKSALVENGNGFPGWHIECSSMSKKLLGDTIDIHMGGIEHIPVHHTNEIAQSESANGKPFVHYWLHNEWLITNGGKMAKSDGTAYNLADVKERGFDPLSVRFLFLQAHYRSKQNFTWESLTAAQSGLDRLRKQVLSLGKKVGKIDRKYKKDFTEKISDDFNTPQALAILSEVLRSNFSDEDKLATILDFDNVLGLNLKDITINSNTIEKMPIEIQEILDERSVARENKEWKKSDELRDKIFTLGYTVKDTSEGQEITKI